MIRKKPLNKVQSIKRGAAGLGILLISGAAFLGTPQPVLADEPLEAGPSDTQVGFFNEDGKTYYRAEDGNLLYDTVFDYDGNQYYVDEDGVLNVNKNLVYDGKVYQADQAGRLSTKAGWIKVDGIWYYSAADGSLAMDRTITTKGITYYVDPEGRMVTDKIIFIDGKYYYFDENGAKFTDSGWVLIDDEWYFADEDGSFIHDIVVEVEGRLYYLGEDLKLVRKNIVSYEGKLFYALSSGAFREFAGWVTADDIWYYVQDNGFVATDKVITSGGRNYYVDAEGKLVTGAFVTVGNKMYYATSSGAFYLKEGWFRHGGWYYVGKDGVLLRNAFVEEDGKLYYLQEDGTMHPKGILEVQVAHDGTEEYTMYYVRPNGVIDRRACWIQYDGFWYYSGEDGKLLRDAVIPGKDCEYYVDTEGKMVISDNVITGDHRAFTADEYGVLSPVSGWLLHYDYWYYAKADGTLCCDEFYKVKGVRYCFDNECVMYQDGFFFIGTDMYYADENGAVRSKLGWFGYEGNWYFSNAEGIFYRSRTVVSRGEKYYFNSKGIWEETGYYRTGIVEDTSYTTVGDRRYHLDESGNPDSWFGIDVSAWNGEIDWAKVAADGVDFAFIRAGGRFKQSGEIYDDSKLEEYVTNATANGIPVGVYFFSQAITVEEAIEEAEYTVNRIKGLEVELPVIIDTEYAKDARHNNLTVEERTKIVKAFCDTVEAAGYKSMYYAGMAWCESYLDTTQLGDYMHWCAQWWIRNQCDDLGIPYQIWQYSESGTIDGIKGNVDLNIWFRHDED